MKIKFIDESGDHNLNPDKVQSSYPLFILVGCIFEEDYYKEIFTERFNNLKREFFGNDDIILHMLELTRPHRSKDKRYLKLRDSEFRINFYRELNKLISETEFVLTACVIKKVDHVTKYGLEALDPYLLSFDTLVDKLIHYLDDRQKSRVVVEKRNDNLDNQLQLAWLNLNISGTAKIKPSEIKEKVEDLKMIPKRINEPGLQLADLVANPIGRHILGIPRKPGHEIDFEIIEKKLDSPLSILPK